MDEPSRQFHIGKALCNRGNTMKLQATLIAASIAMAMSASALAQQATQQYSGDNTNPHSDFQDSRDAVDSLSGYSGNMLNDSESFVKQIGNDNDSNVTQWGNQWSSILQHGDDNSARVQQDDVVGDVGTGENESIIRQQGNNNHAEMDQLGDRNDSIIKQYGNSNRAYLDQNGDLNDSYIMQDGHDNFADVAQHGDELDSDIIQDGNHNDAWVSQNGYGHDSYILQSGNGNYANHTQSGSTQHFAETRSYGHNNNAVVTQGQ